MPSLVEAIRDKYCASGTSEDAGESNSGMILQFVTFKRNETNFVESRNQVPPILVLNNCKINEAGDEHELEDVCKDTLELDIAYNDLSDWNQIHKLVQTTRRLKFLNMSFNNLSEPIPAPEIFLDKQIPIHATLSTLILVSTNISWTSTWALIQEMGQLEELHLSKNNFASIDTTYTATDESRVKAQLKRFVFNDNPLEDWGEVNKIGKCFPYLEHLGLSETLLVTIDPKSHVYFPKLKSLYLSSTKINAMDNITQLQKFPALTDLRIQGTQLFSDLTDHERRQLTIALLPNVSKLNGTPISATERDTSERAFIRYFDQMHLEGNKPERYNELSKIHGKLEPLLELDLRPINKVKLWFILGDKKILKEVKVRQTVSELKTFTRKLFGLDSNRFRLYYQNRCWEEMKFPQKYLYSYNPVENDEIHAVLFNSTSSTDPTTKVLQFIPE